MSIIPKKMRIFIASPSDVIIERERIVKAVNRLKPLSDHLSIEFEILDWKKVVPDMGRPQQVILDQLEPSSWDIFVGILWQRFGSPTGAKDNETDIPYISGTEEEFKVVYNLWKQNKRPRVIIYRCIRSVDLDKIDYDQAKNVDMFFRQFDAISGDHPGLYQVFRKPKELEDLVFDHIKSILTEFSETEKKIQIPKKAMDTFFPSISYPFPVQTPFFGRNKEKELILNALTSSERSWGIIIDGIGGIGKTSLAIETAYLCNEKKMFDNFIFVTGKNKYSPKDEISQNSDSEAANFEEFLLKTYNLLKNDRHDLIYKAIQDDLLYTMNDYRVLLIYDNLEDLERAEQEKLVRWLGRLPQTCKAIVTTRRRGTGDGAYSTRLEPLEWEAAHQIIENYAKRDTRLAEKVNYVSIIKLQELYSETKGSPWSLINILNVLRDNVAVTIDGAMKRGMEDHALQKKMFSEINRIEDPSPRIVLFTLSIFQRPITIESLLEISSLSTSILDSALNWLDAFSFIYIDHKQEDELYSINPLTKNYIFNNPGFNNEIIDNIKIKYIRFWADFVQKNGGDKSYSTYYKLEEEWENLLAAIGYLTSFLGSAQNSDINSEAATLTKIFANGLRTYLWFTGRWNEYRKLFSIAYDKMIQSNEWRLAGYFAQNLAILEFEHGDAVSLERWYGLCVDAWARNKIGLHELGLSARLKGLIAYKRQEFSIANDNFKMALNIWNDLGVVDGISVSLTDLGNLNFAQQNYDEAKNYYTLAVELAESGDDVEGKSINDGKLGELALVNENKGYAKTLFVEELNLAEKIGRMDLVLHAKFGLARVYYKEYPSKASILFEEINKMEDILPPTRLSEIKNLLKMLKH